MMIDRYPGVRRGVLASAGLLTAVAIPLLLSPAAARFRTLRLAAALPNSYTQENLVADTADANAKRIDGNLVNPWGLVTLPSGPIWIADNGTGLSTVYLGNGMPGPSPDKPLVVTVPPPSGGDSAAPTGIVFNGTGNFALASGQPARFLFATEDGTISGWNPNVDATHAVLKVDNSASAVYKGLALLGNQLFAANFKTNRVDVFNSDFSSAGSFTDPDMPLGFAPFGIQNLGGTLFVTYAKQDADKHDDVKGPGNGFVDIFNPGSHQFARFASGGALNSPWGLALAPNGFGAFSNMLLIGNFGDGRINAFNPATGTFQGQISDSNAASIAIEGLWGLSFGTDPDDAAQPSLFFTAGIGGEKHGLFGRLRATGG